MKNQIGSQDFFNIRSINSLDELKKEYHRLALIHHPDKGGSIAMFQQLQAEYEELVNNYVKFGNFTNTQKATEIEIDEKYLAVINEVMKLPGVMVELIGSWIWVSGMTFPIRSELKALGFHFAPLKKMWYINTTGTKTKKGKEMEIEQIRNKYRTKKFTPGSEGSKSLNGLPKISPLQKRKFKLAMSKLIKALKKRK